MFLRIYNFDKTPPRLQFAVYRWIGLHLQSAEKANEFKGQNLERISLAGCSQCRSLLHVNRNFCSTIVGPRTQHSQGVGAKEHTKRIAVLPAKNGLWYASRALLLHENLRASPGLAMFSFVCVWGGGVQTQMFFFRRGLTPRFFFRPPKKKTSSVS